MISTVLGARELAAGAAWALGGSVELDGRLSWVADGVVGRAPVACYLVRRGSDALLVDSGVPLHEELLLAQLSALLDGVESLTLVLTRTVEFDTFGNAGAVLERYPVVRAYSQFPIDEWVWYRAVHDARQRPRPVHWSPLRGGLALEVGPAGWAVSSFDAPLRLLATTWIHEPRTRTLFTSDAFGHAVWSEPGDDAPVTQANDTTSETEVREHLLAKFAWLTEADTRPIREQLSAIAGACEIEAIAPTYGRPLLGRAVVERHLGLVLQALAEIGAEA